MQPLSRRCAAEALGTAFLLVAVVGSGIMAERLFAGQVGLALLANAVATGAALVALILALGDLSGAHFNPIVTLHAASTRALSAREAAGYVAAQAAGAIAGVLVAHAMFEEPIFQASSHVRAGAPLLLGELIATFGLLLIPGLASVEPQRAQESGLRAFARSGSISTGNPADFVGTPSDPQFVRSDRHERTVGLVVGTAGRRGADRAALAVGGYITAAYWFTSSTSFANPAVTVARCLTDTFTGIRPADAPGFVLAQLAGGALAALALRWLPAQAKDEEAP